MKAQTWAQRALCVAAMLLISVGVVEARSITVDAEGVADYRTIKAAVGAAQSGDTIVVGTGTYTGTGVRDIVLAGKVLTIKSRDPDNPSVVAATVIDCQASDGLGHRFIEISADTGAELTLAGLTFINASGAFSGGIVLCEGAGLNAINCTFRDNDVQWWGGALYFDASYGLIEGCTFANNASDSQHGGAIFCKQSEVEITSCSFRENTGNAIKFFDSTVTIVDSTFTENAGNEGGAIYGNTTSSASTRAYLALTGCTFTANSAGTTGGAMHNYDLDVVVTTCTFTGNTAVENGGAIYNHRASPTIASCVFEENVAGGFGGAVANYNECKTLIRNGTFVANEAANGGAVSSRRNSNPRINHCILWDNDATKGDNVYLSRDTLSVVYTSKATVEYSDIEGGQASVYVDTGCTLTWGTGNIDVDPLFTGQVYGDYHLSSDSDCVDAGNPDYLPASTATDRDGHLRFYGRTVDMGAYEYQGLGPVYRFWSPQQRRHFYTISGQERDKLVKQYFDTWTYEGIAFYAFYENSRTGLSPVYRFWSRKTSSHVWTTSETERDKLIAAGDAVWAYEGVVFYAYAPSAAPVGTTPVYRLWSNSLARHFYTMDEDEKDELLTESPNVWVLEGIAFYAYGAPYEPDTVTYSLAGDAKDIEYTLTLAAYVDGQEAQIDAPLLRFTTMQADMTMTADLTDLTATLDDLYLESEVVDHVATIQQKELGVLISLSISAEATFEASSLRGPFEVDPDTGTFADYSDAAQTLTALDETFSYSGLVTLDKSTATFDETADATELSLESAGTLDTLDADSETISASLPQTFQWLRSDVQDLLVETEVDGHLVQIFVTDAYVATQGTWEGMAVE